GGYGGAAARTASCDRAGRADAGSGSAAAPATYAGLRREREPLDPRSPRSVLVAHHCARRVGARVHFRPTTPRGVIARLAGCHRFAGDGLRAWTPRGEIARAGGVPSRRRQ